jgi:hypothetical protein
MINNPRGFLGNIMRLIVSENDTSHKVMSAGAWLLNQFPKEHKKLKSDQSLVPIMVAEIIRYHTPLDHLPRTATQDSELGSKHIKKGDRIVMRHVSGNRRTEMQILILWQEILKCFQSTEVVAEPKPIESNFVLDYQQLSVKLTAL